MYAPPPPGYARIVWRYELTTTAISSAIATPMGMEYTRAAVPASTSMSRISSVAYPTEDSAYDEQTASAEDLESRSCRAWAVARGEPTKSFLRVPMFTGWES